jgi:hypothetical protein
MWCDDYTLRSLTLHSVKHVLTADAFPTNRLENGSRVLSTLSFLGGICRVKSIVRGDDNINLLETSTLLFMPCGSGFKFTCIVVKELAYKRVASDLSNFIKPLGYKTRRVFVRMNESNSN